MRRSRTAEAIITDALSRLRTVVSLLQRVEAPYALERAQHALNATEGALRALRMRRTSAKGGL